MDDDRMVRPTPTVEHAVIDQDNRFVIDPITRKISPRKAAKSELVQFDHNSERYTFEAPRYIEGHDMSLCNRVYIHYTDTSSDKKSVSADIYEVNDLRVDLTDGAKVLFSWLISKNATAFAGKLNFVIRFMCVKDDAIEYSWSTKMYTGISIANGMNNTPSVEEKYSDVLEKWRGEFDTQINETVAYAVDKRGVEVSTALRQDLTGYVNETVSPALRSDLEKYVDETIASKITNGDEVSY